MKIKQAFPKNNNGTIIVYYSHDRQEMKLPTGVSLRKLSFVYWNTKTRKLTGNNDNIPTLQQQIDQLVDKANQIIIDCYAQGYIVSPAELKQRLIVQQETKQETTNRKVEEWYELFIQHKTNHYAVNGSDISIKDYHSTIHLLMDYQLHTRIPLRLSNINQLWLQKLQIFAAQPHQNVYKTAGKMKPKTFKKRLAILAEFCQYVRNHDNTLVDASTIDMIRQYNRSIKANKTHKETLTIKEVQQLHNYQPQHEHLVTIKDLFVFLCMTGIRFQDLQEFDKRFIKMIDDKPVYVKIAAKTRNSSGINYNVPLSTIAVQILEKYNYKPPIISNQQGNRDIKTLLHETGWFSDVVEVKDEDGNYLTRADVVTLHKARNTFITNLIDHVPLNQLMRYTGHVKLSTLQSYVDTRRQINPEYINIFNPSL